MKSNITDKIKTAMASYPSNRDAKSRNGNWPSLITMTHYDSATELKRNQRGIKIFIRLVGKL